MKILHLIDSLNPGGAERMAVGYVNALAERGFQVYLWSSREEGLLKNSIHPSVNYHFLNRKGPVGIKALLKASKAIKKEGIQLIHAHSTSWFFGTLLKGLNPKIKLVWHDHYGSRYLTVKRANKTLIFCSRYFDMTLAVNRNLVNWHETHLKQPQSIYVPNFVSGSAKEILEASKNYTSNTVVCVANLRKPKNHHNLIHAFAKVHQKVPGWNLQLIGKQFPDTYSDSLTELISHYSLEDKVSLLGERSDIFGYLQQAKIGVLSSDVEGLPMTILEYALAGLPVVCTDVGFCKVVVQEYGKVVPPKNPEAFAEALLFYIQNPETATLDAEKLQKHVRETYTAQAVLPQVIEIYKRLVES